MRAFVGRRSEANRALVYIEDETNRGAPLQRLPHQKGTRKRSPMGFEWGYEGAGPAELALAMVHVVLPDPPIRVYQTFKARVVKGLPSNGWRLTEDYVRQVVDQIVREIAAAERPKVES